MPFGLLCCVRSNVEDVVELDYSHRSLTEVPSQVFVYERTLEQLFCQCNRITELPRQLFMCHGLKFLDLSDNDLQVIPTAISSLVNLQHLNISRNSLSTIPLTIKTLKYLTFLDLSVNPLEKLPDAVMSLISLLELYLNDTYLEYLPGNFGRLANLKILELRDNYLMILPKSLSRATELLRLDVGQNEFQTFPEVIGKFSKLKELWIDSNSLTSITEAVKCLENLVHFEAGNNFIEDLDPEIGCCLNLMDLNLSSNSLSQIPETIGNLNNLVSLKLDNNKLYSLPQSIGQLIKLEELILTSNFLEFIPSTIGILRNLKYLNIDDNMLQNIPPEIGSCSNLSVLSLCSNKLTKIPPELGHLGSLKVLNLVKNSLTSLPHSLLNCDKLAAIWLSENQSKPLVPMHSETDPQTNENILTCYLFPQVPLNPIETKKETGSTGHGTLNATKHISFVDMKAASKIPEKLGQLRRAPTPYPKELRALAKHVRNVQKDISTDGAPSSQNTVLIKAAKITPTLQQRFADDNKDHQQNVKSENKFKFSVYDNVPTDDTYDKPLDLPNDQGATYRSVDHSFYPEDPVHRNEFDYETNNICDTRDHSMHVSEESQQFLNNNALNRPYIHTDHKELQQSVYTYQTHDASYSKNFTHDYHIHSGNDFSQERYSDDKLYNPQLCNNSYKDERTNADIIDSLLKNNNRVNNGNYRDSICSDTYYSLKGNSNTYEYRAKNNQDTVQTRLQTISNMINSSTMPNLNSYNRAYHQPIADRSCYPSMHQVLTPNANDYDIDHLNSTFNKINSTVSPSPISYTNSVNSCRSANLSLVSEDNIYSQMDPSQQTMHGLYNAVPVMSNSPSFSVQRNSPSGLVESRFIQGEPPPYHIAAPFTKHAQYFNGSRE